MNFSFIFASTLLAAFAQRWIAIRVWGIGEFAKGLVGDASVHFAIIRHLTRMPRSRFIESYLIRTEPMSYPKAFHLFAGLLSLSTLKRKPWLPNMIFHLLGAAFMVSVSWWITDGSILATVVTVAVYLAVPSFWIFDGNDILYLGLSPRYLARLTSSAAYLGLATGTVLDQTWLLALGAGMATLAVLSAHFARQALFFCVPLLSLVLLDIRPLAWLVLSVFLALGIGRQYFWDGLRHMIPKWRVHRTLIRKGAYVRNGMLGFFRWEVQGRPLWKVIARNSLEKDPTRILFLCPELFLAWLILATTSSPHTQAFALALLPPALLYLLTLTERFSHLGQAYRYVEYNLAFLAPVVAGLFFIGDLSQILILAAYLVASFFLVALRYWLRLRGLRGLDPPTDEISRFIEETRIAGPAVVLPVSMMLGAALVARREDWKTFWWQPGVVSEGTYSDYMEEFPFLKREWHGLAARHGATHIMCDKWQDTHMKDWRYDFSGEEIIAENERFVAYRIRSTMELPE